MTKFADNSLQTDPTVRPQDDFYAYVNNSWLEQHPLPDSESRWGVFDELRDEARHNMRMIYDELQDLQSTPGSIQQQVRDFYYTGMHYDEQTDANVTVLDSLFAMVDGISSSHDLARVLGELHLRAIEGPWEMVIDADNLDSSAYVARLQQGGLTLPDRDYYLDESENMRAVRIKFKEHVQKIHKYFPHLAASPEKLWDAVYAFEYELAEISRSSVALRDIEANYHSTSFEALSRDYPAIDWSVYADTLGWKTRERISVDQPEFFAFVNRQVTERSLDEWKAYLKWQVIVACGGKINSELSQVRFEFFGKVLGGTTEILPLWKRVVMATDDAMGEAAGRLYVERHFPESSKQQVLDLVEKVRITYEDRIKRLDWMSDTTKEYAIKKLHNIKVLIGYPDKWRDFSGLEITRESYLGNSLAAAAFEHAYWMTKLSQPTSRDDWLMDPQTVNAYHDPGRLVICFPAAILQAPFFDPNAHFAANMGGIGTVIGHELTHGFDDQGCMYDAEGNVRTWQTEQERTAFREKAQVIIDQADHFEILPDLNLKGGLIIGESIADLGGIEIALEALEAEAAGGLDENADGDLTAVQLFYATYARTEASHIRDEKLREYTLSDEHPPSLFRVNGMVCHSGGFYKVFGLVKGDGLYLEPEERAHIW